jgi:hypothetical protein
VVWSSLQDRHAEHRIVQAALGERLPIVADERYPLVKLSGPANLQTARIHLGTYKVRGWEIAPQRHHLFPGGTTEGEDPKILTFAEVISHGCELLRVTVLPRRARRLVEQLPASQP